MPRRRTDKRVHALIRGLKVLEALNDLTDASVGDLARASGVAKTTVLRILHTLVDEGYVVLDEPAQLYRVTDKVAALSRGLIGADRRRRVVQPILDGLHELRWPVEFLVPEGLAMVTALNNRDRAPIKLSLFERRRFSMLESAGGLAYLSALQTKDRDALMKLVAAATDDPAGALRAGRRRLDETLRRGHAERDLTELSPGMRACAVPVLVSDSRPIGALVLIHFSDMVTSTDLKRRLLPRLRRAATDIGAATAPAHRNDHDEGEAI